MPHLDDSSLSILRAMLGMAVLTAIMATWMSLVRVPAMKRAGLSLQRAEHTGDLAGLLPSSVRAVADNYNHLFEAPTLFYATGLLIIVAGLADPVYAACAWAFLALRAAHSLVQARFNRVVVRAWVYGLSWVPLLVMIVRPLATLRG